MVASGDVTVAASAVRVPARTPVYRRALAELVRDPIAIAAVAVLLLVGVAALVGPFIAPYDPVDQSLLSRLRPPFWQDRGTLAHPLGTDNLGRDILSRLIYGSRISLSIGVIVVGLGAVVGTALGLCAGYFGGRIETIVVAIVDVGLSFPLLLLALTIVSVLGPTISTVILALGLRGWVVFARVARGQTLALKQYQFIEATRSIGAPSQRILARHLLPNLLPSIMTVAVLELARMVLAESSLSFLGLGVQPPGISWGLMLAEGRNYMLTAPWLVTLPGLAIAATVLSVNILASHVRRLVDPFQRGRGGSDKT
ncbi:MAG: ABC transporter permease [Chloroflexota bacterium]|nr:ABC transporter permease [Chloroflexota bacterium]